MKEKRLTFDNIREMLLELYNNGKDKNGYSFDMDHSYDEYNDERIFFKNGYSSAITITDNLTVCALNGPADYYEELFEADLYSKRGEYGMNIYVQLTNEWILFVKLISKRKNDIMSTYRKPDKISLNQINLFRQTIHHPKTRELIDLLYEKILIPASTDNGGNKNGRKESFSFEGRDEELRSSLYN